MLPKAEVFELFLDSSTMCQPNANERVIRLHELTAYLKIQCDYLLFTAVFRERVIPPQLYRYLRTSNVLSPSRRRESRNDLFKS